MNGRIALLLTLLFCCAAYLPGVGGPFIHDDLANLSLVLSPDPSFAQAFDLVLSNGSGPLLRPIANASFLVNFLAFGASPLGFKLVNLLLHAVCGLLVFLLAVRVLRQAAPALGDERAQGVALFAAALWTAHPMNVTTVLYVVQRMTILSALFSLAALACLAHHFERPASERRPLRSVALFVGLTLIAVLCKENGALTPLLALPVAWLYARAEPRAFIREHRFVLLACIGVPLAVGGVAASMLLDNALAGYAGRDFTLAQRLASEAVILWQYLGQIVLPLPQRLHFFWDDAAIRDWTDPLVWFAVGGWIALIAACWTLRRRTLLPLFAVAWYLAAHALESTVLPLELAYEHRNYLPMLGPLLLGAAGLAHLGRRANLKPSTAALTLVALLVLATGVRSVTWSSVPRLARHELAVAPDSTRAHSLGYGIALETGDRPAAAAHLDAMRRLNPGAGWVEVNLLTATCVGSPLPFDRNAVTATLIDDAANVRVQRGVQQYLTLLSNGTCKGPPVVELRPLLLQLAAAAEAKQSVRLASDYYYMIASLEWNQGQLDESAAMLHESIARDPTASEPLEQLIVVELARGNNDGAREALERADAIWQQRQPWRRYRLAQWQAEIAAADAANAASAPSG